MAPVSSLRSQSSLLSLRSTVRDSTPTPLSQGVTKCGNPSPIVHFSNIKKLPENSCRSVCIKEEEQEVKNQSTKRRETLLGIVFGAFSFPSLVSAAFAEENAFEGYLVYTDDAKKFKLLVPKGWLVGEGESDGIRSITAFYPKEASSSNVSVLISGLGADYTKLESFGKVDEFAETLVSGLDRSWQNPPGVAAKLVNAKSSKGMYYIDYTLQKPGESIRRIYSVLGMASSTWYNKLYTVTGQFMEDETEEYASKIQKVVQSFRLI